jgi:hypothetical protein
LPKSRPHDGARTGLRDDRPGIGNPGTLFHARGKNPQGAGPCTDIPIAFLHARVCRIHEKSLLHHAWKPWMHPESPIPHAGDLRVHAEDLGMHAEDLRMHAEDSGMHAAGPVQDAKDRRMDTQEPCMHAEDFRKDAGNLVQDDCAS